MIGGSLYSLSPLIRCRQKHNPILSLYTYLSSPNSAFHKFIKPCVAVIQKVSSNNIVVLYRVGEGIMLAFEVFELQLHPINFHLLASRKYLRIQGDSGTVLLRGEVSNDEGTSYSLERDVRFRYMTFAGPTHLSDVIAV